MFTITSERSGTLTTVTATCTDEALRPAMLDAFRCTSRFTTRDGLTQSVTCKAAEAARIVAALNAIEPIATPVAAEAAVTGRGWSHRVMIQEWNTHRSPATMVVDGQILTLTGHGRSFIAGEAEGHLWGDAVCYAYYA